MDENGGVERRKKKGDVHVEGQRLAVCRGYRMAYNLREVSTTEQALQYLSEEAKAWEDARKDAGIIAASVTQWDGFVCQVNVCAGICNHGWRFLLFLGAHTGAGTSWARSVYLY